MFSQAASPSSHSLTRPRMMTGWNGLSAGARDSATRGSRRRLRALRDRGPGKKISWWPGGPTRPGGGCQGKRYPWVRGQVGGFARARTGEEDQLVVVGADEDRGGVG